MGVKPEFVRGGTSGINATALKDGQILFDSERKEILLDTQINNQLARVKMTPVMEAAAALADGEAGIVPQPLAGDQNKVLRGDATWGTLPSVAWTYNANTETATFSISNGSF